MGETLRHSFSKQIHAVFADYEYSYHAVEKKEFERLLKSGELSGMNVTIPYKELAFSLCDECSETAKAAGSVNTVVHRNGKIYGENTDVFGFMYMLSKAKISLSGKNVIVLGSGGTSKTACFAAKKLNAARITVVSRSGEVNYDNVYNLADTQIVINTTPVGMYPKNESVPIDLSRFPNCEGVVDVVYNPLKTRLLQTAERLKIPCATGLYMLAAQAFRSAELFLEKKLPETLVDKAVATVWKEIANIVLIGMPGSGKTTIATSLAELTSKKLCDTDAEIEARLGMSPAEIITTRGEAEFREIEKSVVAEISKESGLVISTGGGVVERSENFDSLSQNGRIYFIERDLQKLATDNRPLSKSVAALYERRIGKYLEFSDAKIDNNGKIENSIDKILKDFSKKKQN